MVERIPFASEGRRLELLGRINDVSGIEVSVDRIGGWPKVALKDFIGQADALIDVWDWFLNEVKTAGG